MKRSHNKRHVLGAAIALLLAAGQVHAASFNYHGKLQDGDRPAQGKYDIELTLYTAASGGKAVAGPLAVYNVPVHDGSFSLDADFGALKADQGQTWLGVRMRSAGKGDYVGLSTRAAVSIGNATDAVCPGAWTTSGNAGTAPGTGVGQNFLGTADIQPLVLAVNGAQIAKFSRGIAAGGNVTLGSSANSMSGDGSTIAGGGAVDGTCGFTFCSQLISGDYAVIGGGIGNSNFNKYAVIGGGNNNTADGVSAVVAGGENNLVQAHVATIGGGNDNRANAEDATVAGGNTNVASGGGSAIAGGTKGTASGGGAAVGGGDTNTASGAVATVPGGANNVAGGNYSFAAGNLAHVRDATESAHTGGDAGTFIWSDASSFSTSFTSTASNQFLVRAKNGVGINTNAPFAGTLTVQGDNSSVPGLVPQSDTAVVVEGGNNVFVEIASPPAQENGVLFNLGTDTPDGGIIYNNANFPNGFEFRAGGNSTKFAIDSSGKTYNASGNWTVFSDARLKRDIAPIDNALDLFLGLRGQTFEYIDPQLALAAPGRRMGFIAQDVEKVLPQWVGRDARGYRMVTPTGFEALTVEAVRALRAEKDDEISALQHDNATLHTLLDDMAARLATLEAKAGR